MTATISVDAAPIAFVQDLGRPGYSHLGLSVNGAADQFSARAANILAGNAEADPLIEVTAFDLRLTTSCDCVIAVTGAIADVTVGGTAVPQCTPVAVPAGAQVSIRRMRCGLRCYLAISGQLLVDRVLGSVAPDLALGIGVRLTGGSIVEFEPSITQAKTPPMPLYAMSELCDPSVIDVCGGPDVQACELDLLQLSGHQFEVLPESNHVGLRLRGSLPPHSSAGILSKAIPVGSVEAVPDGGLVVLLRGRGVTAGYPVIAVATSVAQSRLGQVRPGSTVQFRPVELADAIQSCVAERRRLDELRESVAALIGSQ